MALSFAVVREDPALEAELARKTSARQVLVVASGGCTALALQSPSLEVTAFDRNPAQLAHVRAKHAAALQGDLSRLNVEDAREDGLSECGAFEGIFRLLRQRLRPNGPLELSKAAFEDAFSAQRLEAMFGPDATQHAAPGSYPAYFQRRFEDAITRPNAAENPFLQHALLGCYRKDDAPAWMTRPPATLPTLIEGTLAAVPALERFEVVSLSNVFDWSADAVVADWAARLEACRPGTHVLIRQLNNQRPLRRFFEPRWRFDDLWGARLRAADRSFFYERIHVGVRV